MKEVRFFCEFCGAHVRANDKICTSCGSFFNQVRCPECNFQGDVKEFLKGCPSCGYSGFGQQQKAGRSQDKTHGSSIIEVDYPVDSEARKAGSRSTKPPLPAYIGIALFAVAFFVLAFVYIINRG